MCMSEKYEQLRRALLPRYGASEARAIAMLVLERGFGVGRTDVYADKVRYFSEEEERRWANISCRLQAGEPVQYVLGEADFCGRTFLVSPATLIPRPETEELVRLALHQVAACGSNRALRVLDGGTGSGCIAVTLALEWPEADVEAWDVSVAALAVAQRNAERLGASVRFVEHSLLSAPPCVHYDLIVSNPPYVTDKERADMEEHVWQHEPSLALFVPDDDPLRFYHALARLAKTCLTQEGIVAVEINQAFGRDTVEAFRQEGLANVALHRDAFGHDRFVTARK